uniref:Uncharacterized protein n=1 Tax=Arundo donax TaxID=35708 RepID=A0A0A9GGP0_ARUDO
MEAISDNEKKKIEKENSFKGPRKAREVQSNMTA